YRTSPSLSEWFGRLFARSATSVWEDLGRPEPLTVVESGAGRADLAAYALEAFEGPLHWVIVEPFEDVAARQPAPLATRAPGATAGGGRGAGWRCPVPSPAPWRQPARRQGWAIWRRGTASR